MDLQEQVQDPAQGVPDGRQYRADSSVIGGAGQPMLQLDDVHGAPANLLEGRGDLLALSVGELSVEQAGQLRDGAPQQRRQGPVASHQPAGQGHGGHADRGLLEDLPEPLDVVVQDLLVDRGHTMWSAGSQGRPVSARRFGPLVRGQHVQQAVAEGVDG